MQLTSNINMQVRSFSMNCNVLAKQIGQSYIETDLTSTLSC